MKGGPHGVVDSLAEPLRRLVADLGCLGTESARLLPGQLRRLVADLDCTVTESAGDLAVSAFTCSVRGSTVEIFEDEWRKCV